MNIDDSEFEPLVPLTSSPGSVTGPRLAYCVRKHRTAKKGPRLTLSIRPDLVEAMGVSDGDYLRIDVVAGKGLARLQALEHKCPTGGSRQVKVLATGRGKWSLPWCGQIAKLFPEGSGIALEEIEAAQTKVLFRLPA